MLCKKICFLFFVLCATFLKAQEENTNVLVFDLEECIEYAEKHYPLYKQTELDYEIAVQNVLLGLSAWYPQLAFSGEIQHVHKNQVIDIPMNNSTYSMVLSQKNTSPLSFTVSQVLFDRNALYSAKTASPLKKQADLNIENQHIDLVANVTKAFYNVLLQIIQIEVYETNMKLLEQTLEDAQNQYVAGIVDKTDVQRSVIALNNAKASYDNARYMLIVSYTNLYVTMGYNETQPFVVESDLRILINDIPEDFPELEWTDRVEYKQLEVERNLLKTQLNYTYWSYIPTVSLFGSYDIGFSSAVFKDLYKGPAGTNYSFGVTLSIPLFDGLYRVRQTRIAKLNLKRNVWDFETLLSSIGNEYTTAISIYRSNLENYELLKLNMELALEVYGIIQLQYKEGIKTFLDLTLANSDMLNAQLSYYNSVFQLLSSKVDVERSLGLIK